MNTHNTKWLVGVVVAGIAVASIAGWQASIEAPVVADVAVEIVSLAGVPQGVGGDSITATGPMVPRAVWHRSAPR